MAENTLLKLCRVCNEEKPLEAFYKNSRGILGVGPYCKECHKARGKAVWPTYSEAFKLHRREKHLISKYKITQSDYDLLLATQNGVCGMCGRGEPGGQGAFNVDHDHNCCPGIETCGKCIRGLLCQSCNMRLVDDIDWHRRAISYLESRQSIVR